MDTSLPAIRCTRCGKKKKTLMDVVPVENGHFMEEKDLLWSPLDRRSAVLSVRSETASPPETMREIIISMGGSDIASTDTKFRSTTEQSSAESPTSRPMLTRSGATSKSIRRSQIMQDSMWGLASAFGGPARRSPTPQPDRQLEELDIWGFKPVNSSPPERPLRWPRIRSMLSRLGGRSLPSVSKRTLLRA